MTPELRANFLKIIDASLPGATAGAMKDFIEEAEETNKQLRDAKQAIETQEETIAGLRKLQLYSQKLDDRAKEIETREAQLDARATNLTVDEDRMDIKLAELRLECVQANMENMKQLVGKVFGHPGVTITRQIPVGSGDYNQSGQYGGGEILETATETTTKGKV